MSLTGAQHGVGDNAGYLYPGTGMLGPSNSSVLMSIKAERADDPSIGRANATTESWRPTANSVEEDNCLRATEIERGLAENSLLRLPCPLRLRRLAIGRHSRRSAHGRLPLAAAAAVSVRRRVPLR